MKKTLTTIGIFLVLGIAAQQSQAIGDFEKQVKARQAFMQIYSFNLSLLGGMAKGDIPYDATLAEDAANNLLAATNMRNSAMWPLESDSVEMGEDVTRAKPENWTQSQDAAEKAESLKNALVKMAAAAGNGLDAVKANIGAVGKSCKGCHEDFRVPQNN